MKTTLFAGAIAAFVCAGCASQEGATMNAVGPSDAPFVNMRNGKREEFVVGSRIARETRESSELVKTVSRKAYEESKIEKPGSPINSN